MNKMKKIVFISLLSSLFLLTACGSSSSKSATSDTQSASITSNTATSSTKEKNFSEETTSSPVIEESTNTQSSIVQKTGSSTEAPTTSSEATVPSTNDNVIANQDQALQYLINHTSELQNEDIVVTFYKMIDSDYLFSAKSKSIQNQGGSGSVGFYRVSPQGVITNTDAYGTPF